MKRHYLRRLIIHILLSCILHFKIERRYSLLFHIVMEESFFSIYLRIEDLKSQVYNLQNDPRALEKAARNELGMARPNERIFIFEKDKEKQEDRSK